ncbi:vacuolar proteinsorting-associated protein 25, putative [Acanthamoeba castellanii str. Neff]|uniref:ESCRT-II complex subunit VPS25 n=1 Tax=Acanthamoeba castellanii (strain ATCC 30010 / Neff) TaxID=1257118 RepID=L8GQ55_ACACF|nr:vacuolar proteinsorting-associated protein 25, putative [Acanthamoeba castellanii str. Neff]ELR15037.1 vacuolar proteinsorting-associated protein 25, putative [Acanthamoeba castellanii str. Neff]
MAMWQNLILDFTRHFKLYQLDVDEAASSPLFVNSAINRRLAPEHIRTILDDLAKQGNGEWMDKEKRRFTVLWRSPAQWGEIIYKWVCNSGLTDTVMTVYELREGDSTEGEEFHNLDGQVLLKALQALEKQAKCQVFSGHQSDEAGVKFFLM